MSRQSNDRKRFSSPCPFLYISGFCLALAAAFLLGFYFIGPYLSRSHFSEPLTASPISSVSPTDASSIVKPSKKAPRRVVSAVEVTSQSTQDSNSALPNIDSNSNDSSIDLVIEQPTTSKDQATAPVSPAPDTASGRHTLYTVQAGSFLDREFALQTVEKLKKSGFLPKIIREVSVDRVLYEVRVGTYQSKENAEKVAESVRSAGTEAYVSNGQ